MAKGTLVGSTRPQVLLIPVGPLRVQRIKIFLDVLVEPLDIVQLLPLGLQHVLVQVESLLETDLPRAFPIYLIHVTKTNFQGLVLDTLVLVLQDRAVLEFFVVLQLIYLQVGQVLQSLFRAIDQEVPRLLQLDRMMRFRMLDLILLLDVDDCVLVCQLSRLLRLDDP